MNKQIKQIFFKSVVLLFMVSGINWSTQGNYATVGSAKVAIAIVGRGGWAGLSSTVAI